MVVLGVAHAFTPQERGHYGGGDHATVIAGALFGRLQRVAGDALCKPQRKFWGLMDARRPPKDEPVTCRRCITIATRLVLDGQAFFSEVQRA